MILVGSVKHHSEMEYEYRTPHHEHSFLGSTTRQWAAELMVRSVNYSTETHCASGKQRCP